MSGFKRFNIFLVSLLVLISFAASASAGDSFQITRADGKTVPIVVYSPDDPCKGIAIISHGAGASEIVYFYLATAMADMGYLTVVPGHHESGLDGLNKKILETRNPARGLVALITDPDAYRARFMDIEATMKWARERCNARETILIGHSMGAATTMIEAGAKNKLGLKGANSFDMYIALSPQGPGTIFTEKAWRNISKPVLSMTGTKDQELDAPDWQNRTMPFGDMRPGCKWLGVIKNATHFNFAGLGLAWRTQKLTVKTVRDFIDGVHRHDCKMPEHDPNIELRVK